MIGTLRRARRARERYVLWRSQQSAEDLERHDRQRDIEDRRSAIRWLVALMMLNVIGGLILLWTWLRW